MTRKIQVHQVDAFTREPFTGNPTGVVLNADPLSEAQMLAIARELNNAETAFILSPDGDDHTVRARFFTPRSEAGFVGHATVAAQYVLSRRHDAPRWQRQKSKAGIVDVEVRGSDDDRRIAIRRSPPALGIAEDPVSGNAHGLLGAYLARLGLLARDGERARFCGIQGHSLHRPGRVEVELEFVGANLAGVWISGQAVSIFQTEIEF